MIRTLPQLPPGAKCIRCREQATIRSPSNHSLFCPRCFILYFQKAVQRGMKKFAVPMQKSILVAVSGGKDSLAAWDVLHEMGYSTRGLHVSLGIGEFSAESEAAVERFARPRGLEWVVYPLRDVFGYSIPEIRSRTRRKICSVCGLLKRQLLNRLTVREGFEALAVGHNLDDEAGRLLSNLIRHRTQHLGKHSPFLPAALPFFPARWKPLYRLDASEIRTYCRLRDITPLDMKCPLSRGATSHIFKEALDFLEDKMPGTKKDFLFHYAERKVMESEHPPFVPCRQCGQPSYEGTCSVCNLRVLLESGKESETGG